MIRYAFVAAIVIVLEMISNASQAAVQVGVLECRSRPRIGLIIGGFQRMDCVFKPTRGRTQRYLAAEGRVGLDVGITAGSILIWAVFAPSQSVASGALAGRYGGVSGDIALGVGVGANALLGGSRRSIALQPLSVEAQVGVSLAAGITGLRLQYQP